MARMSQEVRLIPSVLDRLFDDKPRKDKRRSAPPEPPQNRLQNVREMKQRVARDLEALLNTRREAIYELPPGLTEVNRSLLTYGLPDFTALSLSSPHDRDRIQRALEQTIASFEPRIMRVRVTLESQQKYTRTLHFRIEALLRIEPTPEPITFDTVLQLNNQEYVVRSTG